MTPALSARRGATWWRGGGGVGAGAGLIPGVTSLVWRQHGDVTYYVITGRTVGPCEGLRGAQTAGSARGQTVLEDEAPSSVLASRQKCGSKAEAELFRVSRLFH